LSDTNRVNRALAPALDFAIADAISLAERIMNQIDACFPTPSQSMTSAGGYPWKGRTEKLSMPTP